MSPITVLRLTAAAPLLAWLPGWLARRAFDTEVTHRLDRTERLFLNVFLSLKITAGVATFLAELGILSLASLVAGLILLCLALWWAGRGPVSSRPVQSEIMMKATHRQSSHRHLILTRLPRAILSGLRKPTSKDSRLPPATRRTRWSKESEESPACTGDSSAPPQTCPFATLEGRPERSRRSDIQDEGFGSPIPPWTLGLAAILVLAAVLFFRPAEAVIVMDDAGVYVIHGLTLARTGGLAIRDPLLPSLPSAAAEELLPFVRYESSYTRHPGAFHIWHWGRGLVQPSFFHLPSIWMAVLALMAGPRTAVWAAPLAGLVAVGGLAFLGRRLFGPPVGLAAALLLTLSFPQVWFARYPTSEIFMQAWLLGGVLLLAVFLQHRWRLAGVAAGVSLGQLGFIRVDAWVAALAIAACFAGWILSDRRGPQSPRQDTQDRWFLVPFGLTLAWAGLHAALFASPYVISLMHIYLTPRLGATVILGTAILLSAAVAFWWWQSVFRVGRFDVTRPQAARASGSLWIAGAVAVGAGAVLWTIGTGAPPGIDTLRWLNWYFTPLGLLAVVAGVLLMIRHGISRPTQVVLLIGLLYALIYLPDPRVHPEQPWGVRRFVAAVIPVLTLAMAYLPLRLPLPAPERAQPGIRLGVVLLLALLLGRNLRPVLAHDEYAGAWDQIEALAGRLEPGAIVLFNNTGVGQAIAQPLAYLYDRPTFILQTEAPDTQVIQQLVGQWSSDGRAIYFALTGLAPWLADLDVAVGPAGDFRLRFPRLERPADHIPRTIEMQDWPIELYRLSAGASGGPVSRLEMEPGELPYIREGFYGPEISPEGVTFRWTDGDGRLHLPVAPHARQLALRVAGPPAGGPAVNLTLLVDGVAAGIWEQPSDFTVRTVNVPARATADGWLDIELRSDAWVPREVGLGDDDRRLGVLVDWIAFQ